MRKGEGLVLTRLEAARRQGESAVAAGVAPCFDTLQGVEGQTSLFWSRMQGVFFSSFCLLSPFDRVGFWAVGV